MSYTLLSGLSANASWALKPGYTQLDGLSADASWFDGNAAVGINSTVFGSPSYSTNVVVAEAVGINNTFFGTPGYSTNVVIAEAVGINNTVFGTPIGSTHVAASLPVSLFGAAKEGSLKASPVPAAVFGVVSGQSLLRANRVSSGARFGTPLALYVDRVCVVSGFASNIGTPYGGIFTEPTYGVVTKATRVISATFGAPSSPVQQACVASAVAASRFGVHTKGAVPLSAFGTHTSFFVYPAAGIVSSAFGAHDAASGHVVSGFAQSVFGSPYAGREQTAAPTNRTRFGTPISDMRGVHKTYGFRRSWFGNHRSLRDISETSGWQSSGFGAPVSHEVHRALHIPPEHKFGTHLMKRAV